MKKFLITAFVAVVLAAWVVPSTAADVKFGGEVRERAEFKTGTNFASDGEKAINFSFVDSAGNRVAATTSTDDRENYSKIGQRVRLWAIASPTDDTTLKITVQDTRNWGTNFAAKGGNSITSGPGLTDATGNHLDLHESWFQVNDFFGLPVDLKVGRQQLVYGDQRLIGAFGWDNNARSFDAAKATYASDAFDVDFFYSKIADDNAGGGTWQDDDQDFWGAYATIKTIPNNSLDVYLLFLREGSGWSQIAENNSGWIGVSTSGSTPDFKEQSLWTYGARLKGKVQSFDYTLEIPVQTGTVDNYNTTPGQPNGYDIDAYAIALKLGYTLPTAQKVRVGFEYDFASGDNNASDGDIETFSNLFPTNHGHYGHADQQGWRNMEAYSVNVKAQATDKLGLYAAYHIFKLAENRDGWYGAGNWMDGTGNTAANNISTNRSCENMSVRAACKYNTQDDVGSELDLAATYKYNKALSIKAGLTRFFVGDLIEERVLDSEDLDYGYLQLTAKF